MKNRSILKTLILILVIIIISLGFIFQKKILLCYNIIDEYISIQSNIPSQENINISATTSMDYHDIVYKNTNSIPLTLDIYSPTKKVYKASPVILYVHGGSWAYGDKAIPEALTPVLDTFRNNGYTIISTSYELMRDKESFSKQVSDIKDTIRWIYKNNDTYNMDPNEIGILGTSSGAHLSLMAAYSKPDEFIDDPELADYPSDVKYLIDLFGPTDLSLLNTNDLNYDLSNIFSSISNKEELIDKFNPVNYVNSKIPDTLIIHSKADTMVPYTSSEKLYEKCKDVKASAKLITLDKSAHDLSSISKEDIIEVSKGLLLFIVRNSPYR